MRLSSPFLAAVLALGAGVCQAATPLYSGVNDVQFQGAEEQRFLGSGFVLAHQGKLYGVTAKHVLLMRKGGPPAHTDVQPLLAHWKLRDPRGATSLSFGRLLNGDAKESVTPAVLQRDILLFELKDAGGFTPLRLAGADPKPGERLSAVGCSYETEATCAQDRWDSRFLERKGVNLLADMSPELLRGGFGLSGAPVLNEAGELVGVVSNVMPDAKGTPRFAPVDTAYLRELLAKAGAS
jgi:hypothetical protein